MEDDKRTRKKNEGGVPTLRKFKKTATPAASTMLAYINTAKSKANESDGRNVEMCATYARHAAKIIKGVTGCTAEDALDATFIMLATANPAQLYQEF